MQPAPTKVSREVSPLELFFDLVFVFALVQLSHHLLEQVTSWPLAGKSQRSGQRENSERREERSKRRRG
jgi:hypothetical protein